MDHYDYEYIAAGLGNLAGIPVRLYEPECPAKTFFSFPLSADPVSLCREELLSQKRNAGYVMTEDFSFYGMVRHNGTVIIIGPVRQIPYSDRELHLLGFTLGVSKEDTPQFLQAMKGIMPMSFESMMRTLCIVNYALNREKLSIRDLSITSSEQDALKHASQQFETERKNSFSLKDSSVLPHNTIAIEETLLNIVSHGDSASLQEWLSAAPAVEGGILAPEQLRQRKNLFIVTATLVSRAAIRGGMDAEDALSLSDQFIQNCELLSSPERIMNLQFHMLQEYTERVERIRRGTNPTKLTIAVANYIQHHLSEPVLAENIARHLYMSRPYLSRRFREEAGETLTDFVLREKTEEGKRLLRYSDKSVSAISAFLGFSSQGHFSRTFRRYAGMTPREYRLKVTSGR